MAEAKAPKKAEKKEPRKKQTVKALPPKEAKLKAAKDIKQVVETAPDVADTEVESPSQEVLNAEELGQGDTDAATTVTKAGKKSPKAQREAEAKAAKEVAKSAAAESADKKTTPKKPPTRSKEERAGKKYREAAKLVDKSKVYSLSDALELATKTSPTKFDATVEMHINLGVDPRQADQNVRDTVILPAGTGKTIRVAVLADDAASKEAKLAGADIAGNESLLALLEKEKIDFDVLIAQPTLMASLGKYARLLGPRGLMPNPKSGTVTADVVKAVKEAKAGKVEYRVDQAGIVHLAVGKVSFGGAKLADNANAIIASLKAAKPASLKGNYIKSAVVTTSMGPSIKVDIN